MSSSRFLVKSPENTWVLYHCRIGHEFYPVDKELVRNSYPCIGLGSYSAFFVAVRRERVNQNIDLIDPYSIVYQKTRILNGSYLEVQLHL